MLDSEPGPVPRLTKVAEVRKLQTVLAAAKFYSDTPDGKWGDKSRTAVSDFQKKYDLKVTGKPNEETWNKLNEVARDRWKQAKAHSDENPEVSEVSAAEDSASQPEAANLQANAETENGEKAGAAPLGMVAQAKLASESAAGDHLIQTTIDSDSTSADSAKAATEAAPDNASPETEVASADAGPGKNVDPESLPISKAGEETEAVAENSQSEEAVQVADAGNSSPESDDENSSAKTGSTEPQNAGEAAVAAPKIAEVTLPEIDSNGKEKPVVVHVNADAGAARRTPIATPATISTELKPEQDKIKIEIADAGSAKAIKPSHVQAVPIVSGDKITAPGKDGKPVASKSLRKAPGATLRSTSKENELDRQMERAQDAARDENPGSATVSNNPTLSVEKSHVVEPVNSLVDKMSRSIESKAASDTDPNATRRAKEELAKAKTESDKRNAEEKVQEVEDAYKLLKSRFSDEVKHGSLADTMAKIDNGFAAMKQDFKKGNFAPIVERCDGFKLAIEMLTNDAAKLYVENCLEKKSVRNKLNKSAVKDIENLCGKNKYTEAADQIDKIAKLSKARS
jgi:peptidoglycan hydrolase-like protein with peptidoglycan-binding domain